MNDLDISKELLAFIESSPSMFHSIATIQSYLSADGFEYLPEGKAWTLKKRREILHDAQPYQFDRVSNWKGIERLSFSNDGGPFGLANL